MRRQPVPRRRAPACAASVVVAAAVCVVSISSAADPPATQPDDTPPETAIETATEAAAEPADPTVLFVEAVVTLRERLLDPPPTDTLAHDLLDAYVRSLDPYSEFLTPAERERLELARSDEYAGVGIEVLRRADGRFVCYPMPGGPAAEAGIEAGDILTAVDGRSTAGSTLYDLVAAVRGEAGEGVRLTVIRPDGGRRTFAVERRAVREQTVIPTEIAGRPALRVVKFASRTADDLAAALETVDVDWVILDLRSSPGGQVDAAIEAARLFLPREAALGSLVTRDGEQRWGGGDGQAFSGLTIVLQDRLTASAAELFTAALVENRRAVSIGHHSFGKASAQQLVPLHDGSAMVVTTGRLHGPRGATWGLYGLRPSVTLPADAAEEAWAHAVTDTLDRWVRERAATRPVERARPVIAIERQRYHPTTGGFALLYEGELADNGADAAGLRVRLRARHVFRYRPDAPPGVSDGGWLDGPWKRYSIAEVGFDDWGGDHAPGDVVAFDPARVVDAEDGVLRVAARALNLPDPDDPLPADTDDPDHGLTEAMLTEAVSLAEAIHVNHAAVVETRDELEAVTQDAELGAYAQRYAESLRARLAYLADRRQPYLMRRYVEAVAALGRVERRELDRAAARLDRQLAESGHALRRSLLRGPVAEHLEAYRATRPPLDRVPGVVWTREITRLAPPATQPAPPPR